MLQQQDHQLVGKNNNKGGWKKTAVTFLDKTCLTLRSLIAGSGETTIPTDWGEGKPTGATDAMLWGHPCPAWLMSQVWHHHCSTWVICLSQFLQILCFQSCWTLRTSCRGAPEQSRMGTTCLKTAMGMCSRAEQNGDHMSQNSHGYVLQSRAEWGPHVSKQPWVCAPEQSRMGTTCLKTAMGMCSRAEQNGDHMSQNSHGYVLQSRAEWGPHVSKQPWVCAASHAPPRTSHHPCTYCSAILWLPDPAFSLAVMSHFYCLTDLSSPSDWQRSFSQSVPLYEHTLDKPADCPKFHHNVNKALCPLPWVRAVWCASSNAHCAVYSTCLSGWSYLSQSEGSIVEGHVTPLIRGALPQGTAPLLYFLFVGTSLHTIFRPMLSTFLVTVSGQ